MSDDCDLAIRALRDYTHVRTEVQSLNRELNERRGKVTSSPKSVEIRRLFLKCVGELHGKIRNRYWDDVTSFVRGIINRSEEVVKESISRILHYHLAQADFALERKWILYCKVAKN